MGFFGAAHGWWGWGLVGVEAKRENLLPILAKKISFSKHSKDTVRYCSGQFSII